MNGIELLKLIGHEIEGHARQSINGERLFLIGGGSLKVDDETLYEGLAKRNDDQLSQSLFGTEEGIPIPHYTYAGPRRNARKVIFRNFSGPTRNEITGVIEYSVDRTCSPAFQYSGKILQKAMDQAWMTTFRVMRGHVDTSNKRAFAMTKDLSYLQGWLLDRTASKTRTSAILTRQRSSLVAASSCSPNFNYQNLISHSHIAMSQRSFGKRY